MAIDLPELPYARDALAPFMSAETLDYHHGKHHNAYVSKANELLEGHELAGKALDDIVRGSFGREAGLFNNIAQHYNHLHFWNWMKPNGGGAMPGRLSDMVERDFGSTDAFVDSFVGAGLGQFGSGWCWLAVKDGKLLVMATPNGENSMPKVPAGSSAKPEALCFTTSSRCPVSMWRPQLVQISPPSSITSPHCGQ